MTRLSKEFAVIATVRALVLQSETRINAETVKQFSRDLETKTGIAVINGFTDESLNMFFRLNPEYFKRTYEHDTDGNPIYEIRSDKYSDIVNTMIRGIDPAINYPMDILRAADMLKPFGVEE